MGTIAQHQLSSFSTPVNGTTPIDANQVRGNDNTIKSSYNAHDADATIHLQSGAASARPAQGTAGQTWLATDSGAVFLSIDNGAAWVDINYLRTTGGTMTDAITLTKAWAAAAIQITTTGDFTSTGSAFVQFGDANGAQQGYVGFVGSANQLRVLNRLASGTLFLGTAGFVATLKQTTINLATLPTSASGLSTGDLWNSSGVVHVA